MHYPCVYYLTIYQVFDSWFKIFPLYLVQGMYPVQPSPILVWSLTGGRLNKQDGLTRYGNSHVKDKTS